MSNSSEPGLPIKTSARLSVSHVLSDSPVTPRCQTQRRDRFTTPREGGGSACPHADTTLTAEEQLQTAFICFLSADTSCEGRIKLRRQGAAVVRRTLERHSARRRRRPRDWFYSLRDVDSDGAVCLLAWFRSLAGCAGVGVCVLCRAEEAAGWSCQTVDGPVRLIETEVSRIRRTASHIFIRRASRQRTE